jgi:hypothetical protein
MSIAACRFGWIHNRSQNLSVKVRQRRSTSRSNHFLVNAPFDCHLLQEILSRSRLRIGSLGGFSISRMFFACMTMPTSFVFAFARARVTDIRKSESQRTFSPPYGVAVKLTVTAVPAVPLPFEPLNGVAIRV